jgi:heme/copper-type cytochrome/quinol oxidase subunit 3
MQLTPPYQSYKYFRGGSDHFCAATLVDLSTLVYADEITIRDVLSHTSFKFTQFINDADTDTQVLIVQHTTGLMGVIFRGTQTFDFEDWTTDFEFKMENGIHEGFLHSVQAVCPRINDIIHGQETYFTG